MALTFAKKAAAKSEPAPASSPAAAAPKSSVFTKAPAEKSTAPKLAFMKTGKAAHQALATEDAKAAQAKLDKDKLWRFWMPPDSERRATILDGEVDADGMLDIPMFYEHSVKLNGDYEQFVCTAEQEGSCVICEKGESKPYLVGVMTLCDHTPYKVKRGPNAGKELVHQRKLLVPKKESIKQLSKIAVKRGGLTGCTFDITRGNDRTAAIGNTFDFVEKNTLASIAESCSLKSEDMVPANYDDEIIYRTNAELIELGLGKALTGPGFEKGPSSGKNLKDEL
jgi:hypothetical protein